MANQLAVGLMSGTSTDGVTAALVEIGPRRLAVRRFKTFPYSKELRRQILGAPLLRAPELSRLNFLLGEVFARAAAIVSRGARPAFIGSHGQTIWHGPRAQPPNTLQIAEPAVIAERTGLPVVADFRPGDVAAGGQGAPLVPAFDFFLFGRGPLRAVVNIGGISNVSFIGEGRLWSAFDVGPGNALLDEAVRRATRGAEHLDRNGGLAARGRVDEARLRRMLSTSYFKEPPPKSLDRGAFGAAFLSRYYPRLARRTLPDALATLAELTARSLAAALRRSAPARARVESVVVSGGGARNAHLMRRLKALLAPVPVVSSDRHGVPAMAKEAACFAWLASRALDGRTNNSPAATGARGPRILGKIISAFDKLPE